MSKYKKTSLVVSLILLTLSVVACADGPTPAQVGETLLGPTPTQTPTPIATPTPVPTATPTATVSSPMPHPPAALGLDPFYEKHLDASGLPIVSSSQVPDAALFRARDIIDEMLAFSRILEPLSLSLVSGLRLLLNPN